MSQDEAARAARNVVAGELTDIIGQVQGLLIAGERLALASGGMVNPTWFRGAQAAIRGAAGDLHSKGLLVSRTSAVEPVEPRG